MAQIYLSEVKLLENERNAKEALDGVDPLRREEAAKVKDVKKKAQILTAGLLLQHGAREFLGDKAPAGIYNVAVEEGGKPYFTDIEGVYFSISHSADMALCAISDVRVGADIQQRREIRSDIAGRFFHPDETEFLRKLSVNESEKAFFDLWCLKESYVKFTGGGLSQRLDELDFTPVLGGGFAVFEFTENGSRIRAELVDAPHGYSAAVIEEVRS